MKTESKTEPRIDSTLSKGLRILEALAAAPEGRGVTALSRELELTKSNTYRLLRTLSELGYVRPTPDRTYQVTMKVWQVGQKVIDNLDICQAATSQMRALSKSTGEAIYLAVPSDISVIYVDKVESTRPIRSFTPKGGTAPMHCVGTGKALLAANYDNLRDSIKNHLDRYTDKTITSIKAMDKDIADTQTRGYAVDHGEYRENIMSFGATIHLPNGEAIAAIGVSAPNINLTPERIDDICEATVSAAHSITDSFRFT